MDNLNIMPSTICSARTLLSCCAIAQKWAALTFTPDKSRSIVIIKKKSMSTTPCSVLLQTEPSDFISFIPSIHSRPVKFLGRIIDRSISDESEKKLFRCSKHH